MTAVGRPVKKYERDSAIQRRNNTQNNTKVQNTQNRKRKYKTSGPGSVIGIATAYGLEGPGIESRWGARFSAPVQTDPDAHPASCKMGTGSFPGVNCGWSVKLTAHPLLNAEVKNRVELYLYSP